MTFSAQILTPQQLKERVRVKVKSRRARKS